MDRIELEIQKSLEAIPQKAKTGGWKGNAQWTSAVKQGLVDVGQANGYRAAASVCNAYYGSEWLYDLVWYQYDDKTENTTDVPFVMECEWGNKEI
ncbi:MAG: hypothetical protein MJA84_17555 [Firmicutes bacterium]|nr:hypothetical protein [Bacillota bacterium]